MDIWARNYNVVQGPSKHALLGPDKEVAFNSLSSEGQTLVLLASMFESEPIPEVVFKILFKSVHHSLAKFAMYSEYLETSNFIQIESEVVPYNTTPRRSWLIDTERKQFTMEIKKKEISFMFTKLLLQVTHVPLFVLYGQVPWRDQAAGNLGIPRTQFEDDHSKTRSLCLIKPLVWLLHAEPKGEWERRSHQLAIQVLHKYVLSGELDYNALSTFLAKEETLPTAFDVLSNVKTFGIAFYTLVRKRIKSSPQLQQVRQVTSQQAEISDHAMEIAILEKGLFLHPTVDTLIILIQMGMSPQVQRNAAWTLGIICAIRVENAVKVGSFPHAVERLVGLLEKRMSPQVQEAALWTLRQISANVVENAVKVWSFPNAMERLVALLGKEMSPQLQGAATLTLGHLSKHAMGNALQIGSHPHAVERLVGLLGKENSPQVRGTAAWTLGAISTNVVENAIKVGSFPHAVERLVGLLEKGMSPQVQEAALWTLGQISANVVENVLKVWSFLDAMERLVALLGKEMSPQLQGAATLTLGHLSKHAMGNALQIGSHPHAVERLVGLLGKENSPQVRGTAAWTLGAISTNVVDNAVKVGLFPNAVERLVGLLETGMIPQVQEAASWTLGKISVNVVENAVKIGSCYDAMERLVELLEMGMTTQVQINATLLLGQICTNVVENARKIRCSLRAVDRLVGLLGRETSPQLQGAAALTLGQISKNDVDNALQIGSHPHALERLVGLLGKENSPHVQGIAAWTLGEISTNVVENAVKVGSFPDAVERLVGLLEMGLIPQVQEAASWTLGQISANVVENALKIRFFPHAFERLVGLSMKGEGMSLNVKKNASWTLEQISSKAMENAVKIGSFVYEKEGLARIDPTCEQSIKEPGCQFSKASEQLCGLVEEFIAETKKRDKGGFLVSAEWLENLEEHEKMVLLSVLCREGFSEIYRTSTTILYKKLDENNADISNTIVCNDESSAGHISDPTRLGTKPVQEEIQSTRSIVDTERKATDDSNLSSLKGKDELTAPTEQLSTNIRSFIAALKERGAQSYCVSTDWLSKLQDKDQKLLKSACREHGYTERYNTSSTTCYERIEEHVRTCNDGSTSDADNDARRPADTETMSREDKSSRYFHLKDQQSFMDIDDEAEICTTRERQPCLKSDETKLCVRQLLEVTCTPPPRSSTGASTSSQGLTPQDCVRLQCGDSYVTLPNQHEDYKIATEVEKTFRMKAYRYRGEKLIEEDVFLQVSAVTTVSCCLRKDKNEKEVRVKFSKIKGQIKHVEGPRILDLVLESVRTNVDAGIYLGDCKTEHIDLGLKGPNRRPVDDGVWLALSGEDPSSVPPGSLNVELRCDVPKRRKGKLQSFLLFHDTKSPVTIEGEICGSFSEEKCLGLFVRYQLVPCYSKPCGIMGKPFIATDEATWPVDLDCVLNYRARNNPGSS